MNAKIPIEAEADAPHALGCASCGSERLVGKAVQSAFWHGDRLVVVKDIPAMVCGDCHEQFYDDATMILLDLLRGEGFPEACAQAELRVPVFSLRDRLPPRGGT